MDTMGFMLPDQDAIFTALAGLLHLGNVKFVEDGDKAKVDPDTVEAATIAAELIGASLDDLVTALTSKKIHVAGSSMTTYLDVNKVRNACRLLECSSLAHGWVDGCVLLRPRMLAMVW